MKNLAVWIVCAILFTLRAATAQQSAEVVWVQIEAHPSLTVAQERARRYAAEMPDVNGFSLGGNWYGLALGPYLPEDATQVLRVYRAEGKIPRDSYITSSRSYQRQFYPIGADLLNRGTTPVPDQVPAAPEPAPQVQVAPEPEPQIAIIDESPAEARRSERELTADQRKDLQRALQWAGFYNAGIDGAFGPAPAGRCRIGNRPTDLTPPAS